MEGGPHSLSSMYEALYYSLLYICSDGARPRSPELYGKQSLQEMADVRRASMQRDSIPPWWRVSQKHVALISSLHKLFFSAEEPCYRRDVSLQEFTEAVLGRRLEWTVGKQLQSSSDRRRRILQASCRACAKALAKRTSSTLRCVVLHGRIGARGCLVMQCPA